MKVYVNTKQSDEKFYIEDENGKAIEFNSIEEAKDFERSRSLFDEEETEKWISSVEWYEEES